MDEPPRAAGRGALFQGKVIANLLDITERRLQQLVQEDWIPRDERGLYSLPHAVRGYIKYLKQGQRDRQRGAEGARLSRAQATKVEMENWRRMGELQVRSQVDETMQGLIVTMKGGHEALPGRLASEFAGISEPQRIYQRLQAELRSILNICVAYLEKRADALEAVPEPLSAPASIGETDADGLGGAESPDAEGRAGPGSLQT